MIGTGALRGFWPAPTTSTMSRPAGTSEIPLSAMLISMILIASSRDTSLAMKMLTLPCTKLSITSFLPVSCS